MTILSIAMILFGTLLVLVLLGMPIAFSLGLTSVVASLIFWPRGLDILGNVAYDVNTNFLFIAIPLFILMAEFVSRSTAVTLAFDTIQKWTRWIPGGLAVSSLIFSTLISAAVGITVAGTAITGRITISTMLKRGYHKSLALGVVGAGGVLSILIPPSISFIFFGILAGVSISKLFIAGIIPGLVDSAIMCIYVIILCSIKPHFAPQVSSSTTRDKILSLPKMTPLLVVILLALLPIYLGIATPTESAGLGCFAAFLAMLTLGRFKDSYKHITDATLATVKLTAMVGMLIVGGLVFGRLLAYLGITQAISLMFTTLQVSPIVVIIGIVFAGLILGCFIDPASIQVISIPLVAPIISGLGFDLIWFGVVYSLTLGIGSLTPPFGYILFVLKALEPNITISDIISGIVPFIFVHLFSLAVIIAFPVLSIWLPGLMR